MTRKEDKAKKRATFEADIMIHVRDRWVSFWKDRWVTASRRDTEYTLGVSVPNYPLPATLDNADRACNWIYLDLCTHSKQSPCNICVEKFMNNIDFDYLYQPEDWL